VATATRRKKTTTRKRRTTPKTVEERIHPLSQSPKWWRGIIYGHPGTGKSTLAASSSEVGRTLMLNADRPDGLEAARSLGYTPEVIDVTNPEKDLDETIEYLRHGGHKEYDFFWVDSGTLYQEGLMEEVLAAVVAKSSYRDPDVPDKPEYLRTQVKLSKFIRRMRGIPINWGITAHVMSIVDEEDGEVLYMPYFQGGRGNLSTKICGYVGVVGHLYVAQVKVKPKGGGKARLVSRRTLQVQPSNKYYAKDGFNVLGQEIIRPTMAQIMDVINNGKEGE